MRAILVPIDYSNCSEKALNVAIQLAKKSNSKMVLLHTVEVPYTLSDINDGMSVSTAPEQYHFATIYRDLLESNEKKLKEKAESIAKKETLQVVPVIGRGTPAADIAEIAELHLCDLIVMGTHGAKKFSEEIIGSNAQKTIQESKVPVLTINELIDQFSFNKIVYASSYNEEKMDKSLNKLAKLCEFLHAELHLVHINTPSLFEDTQESLAKIEATCKRLHLKPASIHVYNDYSVETGILNFANFMKMDVISMTTHGYAGLRKFMTGNVTQSIVNHSNIPVISYSGKAN